jgi:hypothetical protein
MTYLPFHDSTKILLDGDSLVERLEEDGYLFIRGLIPRTEVLEVRERLLKIASEYDWFDHDSLLFDGVLNPLLDAAAIRSTSMPAINRMWCDELVHRLRSHQNILSLFERIFKGCALAHPRFTLRHCLPNSTPTITHQDRVHVGGDQFYSMWTPLGDCPVDQGVLAIVPRSHRDGVLKAEFAGMGIPDDPSWQWVTGEVHAGDVLIFSGLTVHKALPNLTKKIRFSFDARYQDASLPISNLSLTPPIDSGCNDWDSVYKGWSSVIDRYYWKKFNLNVVGFDTTHYEVDYPAAFQLAKSGDKAMRNDLLRLI